jgi:DNA primase
MKSGRVHWEIDDVLARTDLASLLDRLAQPAMFAVRGRRWHCPVPEHDDHHASVTIHTDHRGHERWRCWSGDNTHRGDAIDLVTTTQHIGRPEALDWLAHRAGMIAGHPLSAIAPKKPTATRETIPLDPAVVRYVEACEKILWRPTGRPVLEWLNGRGFSDELLRANRVGADPGRAMMQRQRGLAYGGSIGATFPALDEAGAIAYVQTRYLEPGNGPKYDNPAGHLGTNPRVAWTRSHWVRHSQVLLVCEGTPDALSAAGAGVHSVAILGTQLPNMALAQLIAGRARADGLVIVAAVDNDLAGVAYGGRLSELFAEAGIRSTLIMPPHPGMDLNDWTRAPGASGPSFDTLTAS